MSLVREPKQRFCSCGKPLEIWNVPQGLVPPPIEWVENGCQQCQWNKQVKDYRSLNQPKNI